jgi:hypothetical protein
MAKEGNKRAGRRQALVHKVGAVFKKNRRRKALLTVGWTDFIGTAEGGSIDVDVMAQLDDRNYAIHPGLTPFLIAGGQALQDDGVRGNEVVRELARRLNVLVMTEIVAAVSKGTFVPDDR